MYERERHEQMDANWSAARARDFARALFTETAATFARLGHWPAHPNDGEIPEGGHHHALYHGLAGVCWGQLELAARGYGEVVDDPVDALEQARTAAMADLDEDPGFDAAPTDSLAEAGDYRTNYRLGLLIAELGFMVPLLRLRPDASTVRASLDLIEANLDNRVLELLWGSPGSLLLLSAIKEAGLADARAAELLARGVAWMGDRLVTSPTTGAQLWRQDLYGHRVCLLGAGHGFAGNALAVLRALPHLPGVDAERWRDLMRTTALLTATRADGHANWRQSIDGQRPGRTDWLTQICHGAPGMIVCLAELMGEDPEFDAVLLEGGELVWAAGPLTKGGNFCHGTAGNGYAFLKLFEQTGDERWLARARSFAAAAMQQVARDHAAHGDHHYSLWTGDTGVALFADACLTGTATTPCLEHFLP
ncbi:MAG TPA: LanC-like protein [Pseudomonadales bacterium]|nr:LanC-like protein [Pseudomonadales bacterium]